ncbi:MAG: hypothetical protein M3Q99_18620 [Acidobacteriota bacterium]|nr:hypothetical protein [Acidobacteriota bacterium]
MSVSQSVRRKIRERAGFRCEYCGVSETDSGGELTVTIFNRNQKTAAMKKRIWSIAVSDATPTKAIIGTKIQIKRAFSIPEKTNSTNISDFPKRENFTL